MKKVFLTIALITVCILFAALFGSCGENHEKKSDWQNDFSESEIEECKSWEEKNSRALNGCYYLHYQNHNYPVVVRGGYVNSWIRDFYNEFPADFFCLSCSELFYDEQLTKRCAVMGEYSKEYNFGDNVYDSGYILDGKAPEYGTVLYINETKERIFGCSFADVVCCTIGPDDVISEALVKAGYSEIFCLPNYDKDYKILLSGRLNTVRKIINYLQQTGELGRYKAEKGDYYEVGYNDFFWDINGPTAELGYESVIKLERGNISVGGRISLQFDNDNVQNRELLLLNGDSAIDAFNQDVAIVEENGINKWTTMKDFEKDESGKVIQYYAIKEQKTVEVVYSISECDKLISDYLPTIDGDNKKAMLNLGTAENGRGLKYSDISSYFKDFSGSHARLYACWEDYKVFNLITNTDVTERYVCESDEVILEDGVCPGYEFEGWYTDENFSGNKITSVSYNDGITNVYAKLKKVDYYTLTFEPYDGETFDDITYSYGEEKSLPMLTKSFYIFKGWCTDKDCKTTPIKSIESDFYGNYRLYACFEPRKYTVTITDGDTTKDILISYGEEFVLPFEEKERKFIGYFDMDGNKYTDESGKSLSPFTDGADIILFAKYEEV